MIKNIKKVSDNFNNVYFKKIETKILPLLSGRLINYCLIMINNKNFIAVSSNEKDIGKKCFYSDGNRSMSEHAEMKALKYYIKKNNKKKNNGSDTLLFSLRAKISDNKIFYDNGKPCLKCLKNIMRFYNIENVYFTIDDEKNFYKLCKDCNTKNIILSFFDYSKFDKRVLIEKNN